MERYILKEEYGRFDDIDWYVDKIYEFIQDNWVGLDNGAQPFGIRFPIAPKGWLVIRPLHMNICAGYCVDWNKTNGECVICIGYDSFSSPRLKSSIAHEITHAMQDCIARKEGKPTIFDKMMKGGYLKWNTGVNSFEKRVGGLLHDLYWFEQNAFIAGMVQYLYNGKPVYTLRDALWKIKGSQEYTIYLRDIKLIDYIVNETNNEKQETNLYTFNHLSDYNFKNYQQLTKFLLKNKRRIEKKMKSLLPKIVYNYLRKYGVRVFNF